MTQGVKNTSELTAALVELGLTPGELADRVDSTEDQVHQWMLGRKDIPPHAARMIGWLVEMHRRDQDIARRGPPACEWITKWEAQELPSDPDAAFKHLSEVGKHADNCPVCQARVNWVEEHLGPAPRMPGRGWLPFLTPLFELAFKLPAWARPAMAGAVLVLAMIAVRLVFAIPAVIAGKFPITKMALMLAGAATAGAVGGLVYSFAGKPLKKVPVLGPYLAGTVSVAGYLIALVLMAPMAFGERMIEDPSELVVLGLVSVPFGCILGHVAFRDKHPNA